ncbi:MAG: metal ABC transporter permease [Planctomycetota bacterium]
MTFRPDLDLFPLLAGVLAALTCGLLGNFLVLRKLSLMGDAISHAVLPGLVIAFLVSSSRNPMVMVCGAAVAGLATVVLIELVKTLGRVEPGAAMGVVFSVFFALGVLLIERAAVRHIDLDADCVLYGQLELLHWYGAPATWVGLWSMQTVEAVPRQVWLLAGMFAAAVVFVGLFYKELRIAAFDPALATSQGVHAGAMHYALMLLVAAATVAAFEAVGSILVIAMLIAPAATARLLTDRLSVQIGASLVAALLASSSGYLSATAIPGLFDAPSVSAAGSMTVAAGALLTLVVFVSPSHGVLARALRRRKLSHATQIDNLLAALLRAREAAHPSAQATPPHHAPAVRMAMRSGLVREAPAGPDLTDAGLIRAQQVVRRHRLWESYLVEDAGLRPDHVHAVAEQLEHVPVTPTKKHRLDPHGRPIDPLSHASEDADADQNP